MFKSLLIKSRIRLQKVRLQELIKKTFGKTIINAEEFKPAHHIFVSGDGDNIGAQVEQRVLENDLDGIIRQSETIMRGQAYVKSSFEKLDGQMLVHGGDDNLIMLSPEHMDKIEEIRQGYHKVTGFTITFGVGNTMRDAVKSLIYGKLTGKNRLVYWKDSINKELEVLARPLTPQEKYEEHGLLPDDISKKLQLLKSLLEKKEHKLHPAAKEHGAAEEHAENDTHVDHGPPGWKSGSNDITRIDSHVMVPTKILRDKKHLTQTPIRSPENTGKTPKDFKELGDNIKQHGIKNKAEVFVEKDGKICVSEGTHRSYFAEKHGITHVPAEVRYFGHSDRDHGLLHEKPLRVEKYDDAVTSIIPLTPTKEEVARRKKIKAKSVKRNMTMRTNVEYPDWIKDAESGTIKEKLAKKKKAKKGKKGV